MVYTMNIHTDGGCRGNGTADAIGAAAAVFRNKWGRYNKRLVKALDASPRPTSQRAELEAIILALRLALARNEGLNNEPRLRVTIYSDSKYAVKCMTRWIPKWIRNGWQNYAKRDVVNRDLMEEAWDLNGRLRDEGRVEYVWIPREENVYADNLCNKNMDEQY
ncbi:hypothetical protein N7533_009447 [Penicillium manginii]|jgi:ribonuclease HI|uniref:uncharacterized protein n=1 Tax=Penicillium manginii TaxID=203109 RepID=UPI002549594C|nr:uncharacterized protein N7533_009447 [Penicillium manginii]KAJ5744577.1 hypothetical protein N7533_009447 [Penicillium manginii]